MFKMLIVEDERWEREGLVEFLEWPALGIGSIDTACDGVEGLEKAIELEPDIIITDIQMPGMNGIEMAKQVREKLPDTHIVVLTGYDDFQFVRDALRFSAVDYLLKPVEEEEFQKTMQKVVRHCEDTRRSRLDEERRQHGAEAGRRVALQQALGRLLAGSREGEDDLRDALASDAVGSLSLPAGYAVWAVRAPAAGEPAGTDRLEDWAEEALGRPVIAYAAGEPHGLEYALIFRMEEKEQQRELAEQLLKQLSLIADESGWMIGQGTAARLLAQAEVSYRQASLALRYALWAGRDSVCEVGEEEAAKQQFALHADEFTRQYKELSKQVRSSLGSGRSDETEAAVERLFALAAAYPGAGRAYIGNLFADLIGSLRMLGVPGGQGASAGSAQDLEDLLACQSREEMKRYIIAVIGGFAEQLNEKREHKDDYIVNRVLMLIEERYGLTDLNLPYLAAEVFVSPNHLGMLFKKKTGKTPLAYIQEYRLARAEELLRTTKQRVSVIAERVGIPNTSYFGTLFKQAYGMTPGDYQEMTQR